MNSLISPSALDGHLRSEKNISVRLGKIVWIQNPDSADVFRIQKSGTELLGESDRLPSASRPGGAQGSTLSLFSMCGYGILVRR